MRPTSRRLELLASAVAVLATLTLGACSEAPEDAKGTTPVAAPDLDGFGWPQVIGEYLVSVEQFYCGSCPDGELAGYHLAFFADGRVEWLPEDMSFTGRFQRHPDGVTATVRLSGRPATEAKLDRERRVVIFRDTEYRLRETPPEDR